MLPPVNMLENNMNIEIFAEGASVVKAEVDFAALMRLLRSDQIRRPATARSTPATPDQMVDLLNSVDPRSAQFLREIAASPEGKIKWTRMVEIFGIDDRWASFSGSFGKGITRAFRHTLGHKTAKLVWWDDDSWDDDDEETQLVYIDGPALASLRKVA